MRTMATAGERRRGTNGAIALSLPGSKQEKRKKRTERVASARQRASAAAAAVPAALQCGAHQMGCDANTMCGSGQ